MTPGFLECRQDDLDQPVVLTVVVARYSFEDPVGEPHRIGCGSGGDGTEIHAGPAEHLTDVAATVIDAVQDRLGQLHEPPHQLERQIGAGVDYLLDDQLALQIEVLHESSTLFPVDEGPSLPQRGEPLADIGGNSLSTNLGAELEPQSTLDPGIAYAELKQDFGQPLGTERFEVGEVDRLLRGHPLHFPVPLPTATNGQSPWRAALLGQRHWVPIYTVQIAVN